MGIVEKEGGLPVFDADILKTFFCQLLKLPPGSDKISTHLPAVEGLTKYSKILYTFSF